MISFQFERISLKNKILAIIVFSSVTVLLFASLGNLINIYNSMSELKHKDVKTLARIMALNLSASVEFKDERLMKQMFQSLADSDPSFLAGFIYDANGDELFSYKKEEEVNKKSQLDLNAGFSLIEIDQKMEFNGEFIGHIRIVDSSADLDTVFYHNIEMMAFLLLFAVIGAYLIAVKFQGRISTPILELISAMDKVIKKGDYSVTVAVDRHDELGNLAAYFNRMLEQIRGRDEALAAYGDHLEKEVTLRTSELKASNELLEKNLKEISEARRNAELANEAKTSFLATVSHEIRTPMNGILGMSELLLKTSLSSQQSTFIRSIQHSGQSLLTIINGILDFSKLESAKLIIGNHKFEFLEMLEDVAQCFLGVIGTKKIMFLVDIDPKLPQYVLGDEQLIRQVLVNLLGNAIKFTNSGRVLFKVNLLSQLADKTKVEFIVEDTGVGISKENQERIFTAFTQVDGSVTREYGGTGLGLSITQNLLNAMDSEIRLESELNKGSRFSFELSLELVKGESSSLLPLTSKVTALVLDANKDRCKIIKKICTQFGISVELYNDIFSAIQAYQKSDKLEKTFDLLLCEYELSDQFFSIFEALAGSIKIKRIIIDVPPIIDEPRSLELTSYDSVVSQPIMPIKFYSAMKTILADNYQSQTQSKTSSRRNTDMGAERNILLVEDNDVNLLVAKSMLEQDGHKVFEAKDGGQALEVYKKHQFDLILMDYHMPVIDGLSASENIRSYETLNELAKTPIILTTADISKELPQKAKDAGVDDLLTKPFSLFNVQELCANWIESEPLQVSEENMAQNVLDQNKLEQLSRLQREGQPDILEKIFTFYKLSSKKHVADYEKAIDTHDFAMAFHAMHSLKSSSNNIGAISLSELCATLEISAKEQNFKPLASGLKQLKDEIEIVYGVFIKLRPSLEVPKNEQRTAIPR